MFYVYSLANLGGQKSRVAFAKITFKKPHIILLDEPSNHLVSYQPFSLCYCLAKSQHQIGNDRLDLSKSWELVKFLVSKWYIIHSWLTQKSCSNVGFGCCGSLNSGTCFVPRRYSHGTLSALSRFYHWPVLYKYHTLTTK